jgi:hypothetical protein
MPDKQLSLELPAPIDAVRKVRRKQGRHRAEEGIARSSRKAQRIDPFWRDTVLKALCQYILTLGPDASFLIDDIRPFLPAVPEGADARCWGHITRRAKAFGYIEPDGGVDRSASSNGSYKETYRVGPSAAEGASAAIATPNH